MLRLYYGFDEIYSAFCSILIRTQYDPAMYTHPLPMFGSYDKYPPHSKYVSEYVHWGEGACNIGGKD